MIQIQHEGILSLFSTSLSLLLRAEQFSFTETAYIYFLFLKCTALVLQEVDAASLLRLLLNFDLLDAATELVLEYVDALLGKGHQYFGIEVQVPHNYRHQR